jgi:hypothetical protein
MTVPHLFLIGKDGCCVLNNAQIGSVEKEISKALKK